MTLGDATDVCLLPQMCSEDTSGHRVARVAFTPPAGQTGGEGLKTGDGALEL